MESLLPLDRLPRPFTNVLTPPNGCWLWVNHIIPRGYGHVGVNGITRRAHRVSWEVANGRTIPDGLQIDHLCRVRHCIRPDHLEVVTAKVNQNRGNSPSAISARTNRCFKGHEFTPENIRHVGGGRACRQCRRDKEGSSEYLAWRRLRRREKAVS